MGGQLFWEGSGTSSTLFGDANLNASGILGSQIVDANFVIHMYGQFARFINTQLKPVGGKFRFKIHLEGTMFDEGTRFDTASKALGMGISPATIDKLAASMHMSPRNLDNLNNLLKSRGYPQNFTPVMSTFTQSGTSTGSEGGAPTKSVGDLSDKGVESRNGADKLNK